MPRSVSFFLILQPFWLDVKQAGIYIFVVMSEVRT